MTNRAALRLALFSLVLPLGLAAADIATSINSLGLDLYRQQIKSAGGANVLLSPYSISSALAMTYLGTRGETQSEMQRVLHLPKDPARAGAAFESLAQELDAVVNASDRQIEMVKKNGGGGTPIRLNVANRIFLQQGYALRPEFVHDLGQFFHSTSRELDFVTRADAARDTINGWVAEQTKDKIRDLLPSGFPTPDTRLVLVNALYLRAAWAEAFEKSATKAEPFQFVGKETAPVDTMSAQRFYGYSKRKGYSVVTLSYLGERLQLVVLLPDAPNGLDALEAKLTTADLTDCAKLKTREVQLHLPKFKIEPPSLSLAGALQTLGMKTAFDVPERSANFDGISPRKLDDYFFIGDVVHKTWLALDEEGTEAAAATAVILEAGASIPSEPPPPPVIVRVDHPFLFAIQHVESGACLFLGRVMDPR